MIYSIQFLRGMAAIFVLVYHASLKTAYFDEHHTLSSFKIGAAGVDLFFIISGFIMFYIASQRKLKPYEFIRARIVRIIPLYWFLSLAALGVYFISPQLVNSSGGSTDILSSFLLWPTGNKYLINNGWTLTYEFFFYLIFSMFLAQTFKKKLLSITFIFISLVGAGKILAIDYPAFIFFTSPILLEFILGGILFFIFKNNFLGRFWSFLFISVGIGLLLYQNFIGLPTSCLGRFLYYGVPLFFISIGTLQLEDMFASSRLYLQKLFLMLGNISYSLYLVHPFSLVIVFKISQIMLPGINADIFLLTAVSFSIFSSYLVYLLIEKPLISYFKQ
ncbi:acyltransferase [Gammaproteobacteria bacterium]|nr:acyltransferase [Gammaproteobacteria bacterium]MDA9118108.1 acyltransferase [Gammaproteobacteria bacterium]